MLGCLRLSKQVILMYLSDGSEGSICFILANLGDFFHHFFVCFLMSALIDCLMAETLRVVDAGGMLGCCILDWIRILTPPWGSFVTYRVQVSGHPCEG